MALLLVSITAQGLTLRYAGVQCEIAQPDPASAPCRRVEVWGDTVDALDAGDSAAHWLSDALGCDCRLVYMPEDAQRRVDTDYARAGELVSFADGFPLLLISSASLDDLNNRLRAPCR